MGRRSLRQGVKLPGDEVRHLGGALPVGVVGTRDHGRVHTLGCHRVPPDQVQLLGRPVALLAGYTTMDCPVLPGELGVVVRDGHGTGPQEQVAAGRVTSQGTDSRSRCFSTPGVLSGPNGGETGSTGRVRRAPEHDAMW